MNKFLAFVVAVFALLCLSTPSYANNPWEGPFTSIKKNGDGTWTASVVIHATGKKQTKYFAECNTSNKKCRNQVDGSNANAGVVENNDNDVVDDGSTTRYAVFHPRHFTRYVPEGRGNIWNIDSEPQMRAACTNAGGNCIIVTAPLHNWEAAKQIAKQQTRWPL